MTPEPVCDSCIALEILNEQLQAKVSHYAKLLDDQYGTPCEQIRHQWEIERLLDALEAVVNDAHVVIAHVKESIS